MTGPLDCEFDEVRGPVYTAVSGLVDAEVWMSAYLAVNRPPHAAVYWAVGVAVDVAVAP